MNANLCFHIAAKLFVLLLILLLVSLWHLLFRGINSGHKRGPISGLMAWDYTTRSDLDCSKEDLNAHSAPALAAYYKLNKSVTWGDEDVMALDRSACEQAIRRVWKKGRKPVSLTPEVAKADCAIFRLARSCDPDDMILILRLGSEAPAFWSYRILHDAVMWGIFEHQYGGLSSTDWSRVAAELLRALRISQESWRQAEMQRKSNELDHYFNWGTVENNVCHAIQSELDEMLVNNVLTTEGLHTLANRELAQAESDKAKEVIMQVMLMRAVKRDHSNTTTSAESMTPPGGSSQAATLRWETHSKLSQVATALKIFASQKGRYPLTLDELAESKGVSQDYYKALFIDPITSGSKRFVYTSDGRSFVVKSSGADDSHLGSELVYRSDFTFLQKAEESSMQEDERQNDAISREQYGREIMDPAARKEREESLNKVLLLRMMAQSYFHDEKRYPSSLEEVFPTDNKYLKRVGDPMLKPFADASLKEHRVTPPNGYQWYYRCSKYGKDFMLGLRREGETKPEVDRYPLVSTQLPVGHEVTMPGTVRAHKAAANFRE